MKSRWWNKRKKQKRAFAVFENRVRVGEIPNATLSLTSPTFITPTRCVGVPRGSLSQLPHAFVFLIFPLILVGCSSSKPTWEYMPDMSNQPALKAQRYAPNLPHHRGMLTPVPGTIPRNYEPYPYKEDPEGAGKNLKNPLPVTQEVLAAGQKTFNAYCIVCHGPKGLGDGPVVPSFPKPPSLQSEKVRDWPDGRIYHVITTGQNLMPSYASQIPDSLRWAVVRYLRAIERAENPTPEDIEAYKKYRTEKKK